MKKRRFMGIMALASCVTLLTGCDSNAFFGLGGKVNEILEKMGIKKKDEKQDDTPQEDTSVSISVSGLPEEIVVGTVLNFENYVQIKNSSASFSLMLNAASSKLAKVSGHNVTITGEGEITVMVLAEGKSAIAKFNTISQQRKEFRDMFKDVGDNYSGYNYDWKEVSSKAEKKQYEFELGGKITHGEKYTYNEEFFIVGHDANKDPIYKAGGYVVGSDKVVYSYALEEEKDSSNNTVRVPHLQLNGDEPEAISDVTSKFAFDYNAFELVTEEDLNGEEREYLVLSPDAGGANKELIWKTFGLTIDLSDYDYIFDSLYVHKESFKDPSNKDVDAFAFDVIIKDTDSGEYEALARYVLFPDSDNKVAEMEKYVKDGEKPHGYSLDPFADAINQFADPEGSFCFTTTYGMYEVSETIDARRLSESECATYKAYFDNKYGAGTIVAAMCDARGEIDQFHTPKQIHVTETGMEDLAFGFIEHDDGKVYSYAYDSKNQNYKATINSAASISKLSVTENLLYINPKVATVDLITEDEMTYYDDIFVNTLEVTQDAENPNKSHLDCEFSGSSGKKLLDAMLYDTVPQTAMQSNRFGAQLIYYNMTRFGWELGLEVHIECDYDESTQKYSNVKFSSYWDIMQIENSDNRLAWGFESTFTDKTIPAIVITGLPEVSQQ